MNCRIFLLVAFLILFLGSASAIYELCDSVERDNNGSIFRCNITTPKTGFTQQDIDGFWQNVVQDGGFTSGRMKTVEWKIMRAVIQYSDDVRFLQSPEMNLNWDIILEGTSSASLDINQAAAAIGARAGNQTAIKKIVSTVGTSQEYLLSFAPLGNRKGVRNISLTMPADGLAVYISGSTINKGKMEIGGDLTISGAFVENLDTLKAKSIILTRKGSIRTVESIEADSISLDGESYIRNVGDFSRPALVLNGATSLSLQGSSWIEELKGGIEAEGDISITGNSRLENLSLLESESIQWIYAKNLTLTQGRIRGFGGQPGEIALSGNLKMDAGQIIGKEAYKPSTFEAVGISLENKSTLQYFTKKIKVTGKGMFSLKSGSIIKNFSGEIESCAPLKMDGNATKLVLDEGGTKKIEARAIELTTNAEITCTGEEECEYNFVQLECGAMPTVTLDVNGAQTGDAPLIISFTGSCNGHGVDVTCVIDFGDGSEEEAFYGNVAHAYQQPGDYSAWLTATNDDGQTAKVEKFIYVTDQGSAPAGAPVLNISFSSASVKKGEEFSLNIGCEVDFNRFKVTNDLGLPAINTVPQSCPVTLGPFKPPEDLEPGIYNFTVSGATSDGKAFSQTVSFTVEAEAGLDLEGILPYAGAALLLAIVCIVALVALKKKGLILKPKGGGKQPLKDGKQPPEKETEKKPKKEPSATPWMDTSENTGEKPPWLMEGGSILPTGSKQAQPPQPTQPPKPAQAPQPAQPQQQPAAQQPKPVQPTTQKPQPVGGPGTAQPQSKPAQAIKKMQPPIVLGKDDTQIDSLISELESIETKKKQEDMHKQAGIAGMAASAKPQTGKKIIAPSQIVIPPAAPKKKKGFKIPGFGMFKRKKKAEPKPAKQPKPMPAKQPGAVRGTKPAKAAENLFGKPEPAKKSRFGWLKKKKKPTAGEKLFGKTSPEGQAMPTQAAKPVPPPKRTWRPIQAEKPKALQEPKPAQAPKPVQNGAPAGQAKPAQNQAGQPKPTQAPAEQPKPTGQPKSRRGWLKKKKPEETAGKKPKSDLPAWLKKIEDEE